MGSTGRSSFGPLLHRRRLEAGLTQEELAGRSALSVRTVRDLERGTSHQPYPRTVALLAGALGLTGADREELLRAARPMPAVGEPAASSPSPASPSPAHASSAPEPDPAGPRQLPAAPVEFVGRSAELKALADLLERGTGPPGAVLITAIDGSAGVGKTALAVHWCHQLADRFPDGQLYVNLRGYDPGQPMPPADALARFLRALGVPGQDIPAETEERAARYRSLLAGHRTLVLLDNAGSVEQVRPLLPGTGTCAVVVTSRDALAGLVARDGARRLDLDLLSPADADILLTRLIGDRAAADPLATTALASACARLPLALRIAAELTAARPAIALADLVNELADQHRRLDLLDAGGDPYTAVRAVFSWSCQHLDSGAARTFRLLGLHPGPDFEAHAAAALTAAGLEQARHRLDLLERAHLIHQAQPGRYTLHDLLHAYAAELADGEDGPDECRAALTRLFDYYLHTAVAAVQELSLLERHERPSVPGDDSHAQPLSGQAESRAWLDAHRGTLVAVAAYTAGHGWPGHTTRVAAAVARYLDTSGHYPEGILIHAYAQRAARQAGDQSAEATALTNLGLVAMRQGRFQQAGEHLSQAVALGQQTHDQAGQRRAVGNLAIVAFLQGDYDQATRYHTQVLELCRETGDQIGEARALANLALVELRQGRYEPAASHLWQALDLARQGGSANLEAHILTDLGLLEVRHGSYEDAAGRFEQALALHREAANLSGMAYTLATMALGELRQDRREQAAAHLRQALALFRDTGEHAGESGALNGLGELFLASGQPAQARAQHAAALALASQIGEKYEEARAHNGLGHAHQASGDHASAVEHWQRAIAGYTELGAPEAGQIRAELARLGPA